MPCNLLLYIAREFLERFVRNGAVFIVDDALRELRKDLVDLTHTVALPLEPFGFEEDAILYVVRAALPERGLEHLGKGVRHSVHTLPDIAHILNASPPPPGLWAGGGILTHMSERQQDNPSEDQIRYFCDNINLGYTDEAFMLRLESGATKLAFTMTPEHAKRLMLALTRYVNEFEEEHRRVRVEWPPQIESPYTPKDLSIPPQKIDELYPAAMEYVIKTQRASTSILQRKFNIGYSRAALLIDLLEEHKVIGPSRGATPRAILIPHEKPARKKK